MVDSIRTGWRKRGLLVDEEAFGRYRLLSVIGEVGMGRVSKLHDTVIDRDVAIKVLLDEAGYEQRFRRVAHTAAWLVEPGTIAIHEVGQIAVWPRKLVCPKAVAAWPGLGVPGGVGGLR